VVNWLKNGASALPDRSCRPPVATTEITEPAGNAAVRLTVRLSDECEMLAPSWFAPANSARLLATNVLGLSDSENTSDTTALSPAPVAPSVGVTDTTAGAVVSNVFAVVNWANVLGMLLPARSLMVLLLFVLTLIGVAAGYGEIGVNVMSVPAGFTTYV